jgi:hypothetical protein
MFDLPVRVHYINCLLVQPSLIRRIGEQSKRDVIGISPSQPQHAFYLVPPTYVWNGRPIVCVEHGLPVIAASD